MAKTDKSLMRDKVSLVYKIRDRLTRHAYKGVFEIGETGPGSAGLPEVMIKSTVRSWVSDITIKQGCDCEIWVEWAIPQDQQIVRFKFLHNLTYVELSRNLGIPRFELNKGSFEVTDYEIAVHTHPVQATEL
jgi:hypothetical protein